VLQALLERHNHHDESIEGSSSGHTESVHAAVVRLDAIITGEPSITVFATPPVRKSGDNFGHEDTLIKPKGLQEEQLTVGEWLEQVCLTFQVSHHDLLEDRAHHE